MTVEISLNGDDWLYKDFYGEDWLWRGSHKPANRDVFGWRTGTVPGSVLHDLWQAGVVPEPYYARNSLLAEWVPARTWIYKKTFTAGAHLRGSRIRLRLVGVDYAARFYLNGELLGSHTGMYTPVLFEVTDRLNYGGENLLAVVIEAAPHEEPQVGRTSRVRTHKARMNYWWDFCPRLVHQGIWDHVALEVSGQVRIEDVYARPQLSAGRDHADVGVQVTLSAVHAGPVELETRLVYGSEVIAVDRGRHNLATGETVVTTTLSVPAPRLWWPNGYGEQPLYQAEVAVWSLERPDLAGPQEAGERKAPALVTAASADEIGTFSFPAEERAEEQRSGGAEDSGGEQTSNEVAGETRATDIARREAPVPQPFPSTPFSSAPLPLRASASLPLLSDRRAITFGIRSISLAPNEAADPAALPYTLVVNGRRIYANGWNWVPVDALYGVPHAAKQARLFELAVRAHVNLLRVWGGGLIERAIFYELCDRNGILVWQEFILSSSGIDNAPSGDPAYVEMLAREAEQIVPGRRNHACLAIWCGGNELQDGPESPLVDERSPALAALHEIVARLDPDRAWLPTSPSGRFFGNSLENIAGDPSGLHDVHGPWEHQGLAKQYALYNLGASLLHSEFGVEGLANLRTLEATIPPGERWPVTRANPAYFHTAAWWLREGILCEAFGELPDLAATVRASQFLQHDGLRYAVEADRRRQWHNSGTLPWQFNEPFPNAACTSAVDYYTRPKPAYYAVAGAYAPLSLSARFEMQAWAGQDVFRAEVWLANNGLAADAVSLTTRIMLGDGREAHSSQTCVLLPVNAARAVAAVEWPPAEINGDLFFLDLALADRDGYVLASNRYLFSQTTDLTPMLRPPATTLAAGLTRDGPDWRLALTNTGPYTALGVWLEDARPLHTGGGVYFDQNYFHLLPGETRTLTATWQEVPDSDRALTVGSWNAPENVVGGL